MIYAFTVTRANTPERCRQLVSTVTEARRTAGQEFFWHVVGSAADEEALKMLYKAGLINSYDWRAENIGQHIAWNNAYGLAEAMFKLHGHTDYFLRLDDDVEFKTKRWLRKMTQASVTFDDKFLISPTVRGLKHKPPVSMPCEVRGIEVEFLTVAIGGICRLHPARLLAEHAFVADVRKPLGSGDATGVGAWAVQHKIPMVYLRHVNVRHARSNEAMASDDLVVHDIFQHIPYIPAWRRHDD